MNGYNSEDFYEPSEIEIMFAELRHNILKTVKEEYVSEMEKLKNENAELQDVKKNFEQIKRDHDRKKRELEYEYQDLKSKVRRERLSELMKDYEVELWTVSSRSKSLPKCDKCDDKRRIHYVTPLGKETYESCDCDMKISIYEPIPIQLSSFSIRDGKGQAWYKLERHNRDEWISYYEDSIHGKELITDESQFENVKWAYRTLFKTEEIAQKYCDQKNNEEVARKTGALRKK